MIKSNFKNNFKITNQPAHRKNQVIYRLGRFFAINNNKVKTVPIDENRQVKTAKARTTCVQDWTLSPRTTHFASPGWPVQRFHNPTLTGLLLNHELAQSLPDTQASINPTEISPSMNINNTPHFAILQTPCFNELLNARFCLLYLFCDENSCKICFPTIRCLWEYKTFCFTFFYFSNAGFPKSVLKKILVPTVNEHKTNFWK